MGYIFNFSTRKFDYFVTVPTTPSNTVFFDTEDPNDVATVFDPNTPEAADTLYVSQDVDTAGATWVWNSGTSTYETETITVPASTPFFLAGTAIDAGSNKTAIIQRSGEIRIVNSTLARSRVGSGGRQVINASFAAGLNYTVSGGADYVVGTSDAKNLSLHTNYVERIGVASTGAIRFNSAYTFPTIAPAIGQVLGYGAGGITEWVTPSDNQSNTVLFADLATTEALNTCTYYNGIANDGVGATLTGSVNGQLATISNPTKIDNIVTALNQVILVWSQSNAIQNGLYKVTQLGSVSQPFILVRAEDADQQSELYPIQVNIFFGQLYANRAFLQKTVDPIVGTSNIVFAGSQIGISTAQVNYVDTATSGALPSCTYASGTNIQIPGINATLTADVNGSLGTINGVALIPNMRILVRNQSNAAHNGDYIVNNAGGVSSKWKLYRVSAWGGEFLKLIRDWKVNNSASTKFGSRYSTDLVSLTNLNVGITNLIFNEVYALPSTYILPTADGTAGQVLGTNGAGQLAFVTPTSGGIIWIKNLTTGIPTYYATLELASTAAVSGQTINVGPGTYTVTTTATDGLAKNGVNWYFEAGAIVNKATTGSLFNLVGFTSGGNVFGQGNFYKTSTVGKIFNMGDSNTSPSLTNATFEFDICSSTIDVCIINHSLYQLKTSGMSCISTGNTAMWLGWGGNGSSLVNVAIIKSTAATAIKTWGSQNASSQYVINSSLVTSTVAVAIWGTCGVYNIGLCSGVTYGYQFGYYGGDVSINGNSNGIYAAGLSLVLNGKTDFLNVASGIVVGGITLSLTVSGGTVNTTVQGNYPSVIISGGVSTIILKSTGLNMTVSGGVLNILSCLNDTGGLLYNTGQYVSGGRLNILCPLYFSNMNQGLLLSSGTIYLSSSGSINMTSTSRTLKNAGIRYQGGKIISNGGTFTVAEANCLPIAVETSNRDIKILSAGLNTNSLLDFLPAKKQKTNFTITAVASTSITLNATTLSESDTATYNTKALLASRMTSLINASALNAVVIATYTASNDFFEVEALVAGTAFTNSALTNITALFVIENSYTLNNITAGTLIQDVDVEQ